MRTEADTDTSSRAGTQAQPITAAAAAADMDTTQADMAAPLRQREEAQTTQPIMRSSRDSTDSSSTTSEQAAMGSAARCRLSVVVSFLFFCPLFL